MFKFAIQKIPFKTTGWSITKTTDELRRRLSQKRIRSSNNRNRNNLLLDSIFGILAWSWLKNIGFSGIPVFLIFGRANWLSYNLTQNIVILKSLKLLLIWNCYLTERSKNEAGSDLAQNPKEFKNFSKIFLSVIFRKTEWLSRFNQSSISVPPENIRNVFWPFQGLQKWNVGLK